MKKTPHDIIWGVLDKIAERRGISPSRLAITAGLDPTAFNPSRRVANGNTLRFPSLTTLLAVLKVSGMSWHDFADLWVQISLEPKEKTNGRQ